MNCWRCSNIQSFANISNERLEAFMNIFKFNVSSVLSSDFIEYCEVVFVVVTVISFKVDLIKPVMITFFVKPNLCDGWLDEFGWNFVFDQVFDFFEMTQNLFVDNNNVVSHSNSNIDYMVNNSAAFKLIWPINNFFDSQWKIKHFFLSF